MEKLYRKWLSGLTNGVGRFFRRFIAPCLLLAACTLITSVVWANSLEKRYEFRIEEERLGAALEAIVQQTDLIVLYPQELADRTGMKPVLGRFTVSEAFEIMFQGTEFSGGLTASGVLYIALAGVEKRDDREENVTVKKRKGSLFAALSALIFGAGSMGGAEAQDANNESEESGFGIEEIIVTARKREEAVQDIPLSIRALSEHELEQMGADDFLDYARTVAGLSFINRGPGRSKIVLRGVSEGPSTRRNAATTGIYIDEIPVTRNGNNPNLKLFDIQRVEVLRGPQGTLYGAASMGGTIKMVTNKPDAEAFASKVEARYSDTRHGGGNTALSAMVNVPLVDGKVAFRAVGYYRDESGFIDNPTLGQDRVNTEETWGARLALRFEVSEALTATASMIYQHSDLGAMPEDDLVFDPVSLTFTDTANLTQTRFVPITAEDELEIYNLTVDYDFGWSELTSSTSYFKKLFTPSVDLTPLFSGPPFFTLFPAALINSSLGKELIQETRLASTGDSRMQWLAGIFYSDRDEPFTQYLSAEGFDELGILPFPVGDAFIDVDGGSTNRQVAVFGEISYDITDDLRATAGMRWFDIKNTFNLIATGFLAGVMPGQPPQTEDVQGSESSVNPKFLISYRVSDDALLYAGAAQGYRSGGVNNVSTLSNVCGADLAALGLSEPPSAFDSDSLWNYELGAKTSWFGDRLILNGAVFYIDWSDIQLPRQLMCGFTFIDNAGKATSKGFELEMNARPLSGLDLTGSLSFNDVTIGGEPAILAALGAVDGEAIPGVPKWSFSFAAQYAFPLTGNLTGFLHGDYQYVQGSQSDFDAMPHIKTRSYGLGNLRAGVSGDSWEMAVFVNNVWDKRAVLSASFNPVPTVVRNRPRTVGVNVRKTF